jgi:hypothetical protein
MRQAQAIEVFGHGLGAKGRLDDMRGDVTPDLHLAVVLLVGMALFIAVIAAISEG